MLRCGAVAVFSDYSERELGQFCYLGNVQGELHSWRPDGRWSDEGVHPLDILSIQALNP